MRHISFQNELQTCRKQPCSLCTQQVLIIACVVCLHRMLRCAIPLTNCLMQPFVEHMLLAQMYSTKRSHFFLLTEHGHTQTHGHNSFPLHYTLLPHTHWHKHLSLLFWPQSDPLPMVAVSSRPSNWVLAWKVLSLAKPVQFTTEQIGWSFLSGVLKDKKRSKTLNNSLCRWRVNALMAVNSLVYEYSTYCTEIAALIIVGCQ